MVSLGMIGFSVFAIAGRAGSPKPIQKQYIRGLLNPANIARPHTLTRAAKKILRGLNKGNTITDQEAAELRAGIESLKNNTDLAAESPQLMGLLEQLENALPRAPEAKKPVEFQDDAVETEERELPDLPDLTEVAEEVTPEAEAATRMATVLPPTSVDYTIMKIRELINDGRLAEDEIDLDALSMLQGLTPVGMKQRAEELSADLSGNLEALRRVQIKISAQEQKIENLNQEAEPLRTVYEARKAPHESALEELEREYAKFRSGLKEMSPDDAMFKASLKPYTDNYRKKKKEIQEAMRSDRALQYCKAPVDQYDTDIEEATKDLTRLETRAKQIQANIAKLGADFTLLSKEISDAMSLLEHIFAGITKTMGEQGLPEEDEAPTTVIDVPPAPARVDLGAGFRLGEERTPPAAGDPDVTARYSTSNDATAEKVRQVVEEMFPEPQDRDTLHKQLLTLEELVKLAEGARNQEEIEEKIDQEIDRRAENNDSVAIRLQFARTSALVY